MVRTLAAVALVSLAGCADQSKSAALNECRMSYALDSPADQAMRMPECMQAKSFQPIADCAPQDDRDAWDPLAIGHPYNDPRCYRPIGATRWIVSTLEQMWIAIPTEPVAPPRQ